MCVCVCDGYVWVRVGGFVRDTDRNRLLLKCCTMSRRRRRRRRRGVLSSRE